MPLSVFVRIRADGRTGRQGTGLGLFISRSLIEQHWGTLSITSSHGKGTTVTIWMPHGRVVQTPG
jgi:two-component system sensor histidine kinase ResE